MTRARLGLLALGNLDGRLAFPCRRRPGTHQLMGYRTRRVAAWVETGARLLRRPDAMWSGGSRGWMGVHQGCSSGVPSQMRRHTRGSHHNSSWTPILTNQTTTETTLDRAGLVRWSSQAGMERVMGRGRMGEGVPLLDPPSCSQATDLGDLWLRPTGPSSRWPSPPFRFHDCSTQNRGTCSIQALS